MAYKVVVTKNALQQLENIIDYLVYHLHNRQAATGVIDDFQQACKELTYVATSIVFCNDKYLAAKGYRKLALAHHKYLLLYQVRNEIVYVNGIFHMLEKYRDKL